MNDFQDAKLIETHQTLELDGKIYLVHKNQNGTEIDREELNGVYMLQLLETILSSNIDNLILPELLEQSLTEPE